MRKKSNNLMHSALSNKKEGKMKKSLSIGFLVLGLCLTLTALAYGEGSLGVNVVNPQYNADVSSAGTNKSQLHFSSDGSDVGGWLTSVLENNFWISSGAVYDATQGGWIQKSSDGRSVFAGSGAGGFRIFAQQGTAVGSVINNATTRFVIGYNGYVGFGNLTPAYPLQMASGARCTTGGVWTNASSREYKENIQQLSSDQALLAFNKLDPVTFNYKADSAEKHVGFIAEDVPDLVATPDRKALSTMDIVAVLTKVVQEQQKTIAELTEKVSRLEQQVK
jgi:hypothetical protein